MPPKHVALAIVVAALWGFNFVVIKVALVDLPPIFLTAIRFALAALPVFMFPRPVGMTWSRLIGVGLTMFCGQFILLFLALANGMPAGLASVTLQAQVFITILLATVVLREWPTPRQVAGGLLCLVGMGFIAATAGAGTGIPITAMVFMAASATAWAIGNVLVKTAGPGAGFGTLAGISWISLVPIVPALLLSLALEGQELIIQSITHVHWLPLLAVAYIVAVSTWFGYGVWGRMLSLYPAAIIAPFMLLVPIFGTLSAWIALGERLTPMRLAGSALIVTGLAVIIFPAAMLRRVLQSSK